MPANTGAQLQEAERETEQAHNPQQQINPQPPAESSIMPESHIPPGASYTAGPGGASVFKSNSESHTLSQENTPRQPHLSPARENHGTSGSHSKSHTPQEAAIPINRVEVADPAAPMSVHFEDTGAPVFEYHGMTNVDNVGGIEVDMDRDNNTAYIHSSSDAEVEVCILPKLMVDLLILRDK